MWDLELTALAEEMWAITSGRPDARGSTRQQHDRRDRREKTMSECCGPLTGQTLLQPG